MISKSTTAEKARGRTRTVVRSVKVVGPTFTGPWPCRGARSWQPCPSQRRCRRQRRPFALCMASFIGRSWPTPKERRTSDGTIFLLLARARAVADGHALAVDSHGLCSSKTRPERCKDEERREHEQRGRHMWPSPTNPKKDYRGHYLTVPTHALCISVRAVPKCPLSLSVPVP